MTGTLLATSVPWQHHLPPAAALAVFVCAIAYVRSPRIKALIYSLPVPFLCAQVATGLAVDSTHMLGLGLVVGYNWLVYLLARRAGWHLGAAILVGVALYVGSAALLRPMRSLPLPFAAIVLLAAWLVAVLLYQPRAEPGHRSRMPWWLKAPLVFVIGLAMYRLTGLLGGAVATFPYAGVFTSYEARHSLRTLAGQFTLNCIGIWLLIVVAWAVQHGLAFPWPLALGAACVPLALAGVYLLGLGRAAAETAPAAPAPAATFADRRT